MGIIAWIVFGLIVGLLARALMPGRDSMGIIMTILLGIAGGFVGGWVGQLLGLYEQGEAGGLIMATLGAILVLFVYNRAVKGRSRKVTHRHRGDRAA